jgi:uncharacterized protein
VGSRVIERLGVSEGDLHRLCRRWGIAELAVFGSALGEAFGPESDVDLLVTFQSDASWSFEERLQLEDELGRLFGRRIDLVTRRSVERTSNYIVRRTILNSAAPVHVAG